MLKRKELYEYLDSPDLVDAISIWQEYRRYGLPHAGGTAGETYEYIELINMMEREFEAAQSEHINQ